MNIQLRGKYWYISDIPPEFDKNLLLGWRQKKGDPYIIAEDNAVNSFVLGQARPWLKQRSSAPFTPDMLSTELLPFQINDIFKMVELPNFLNTNPMGLGKTIETALLFIPRYFSATFFTSSFDTFLKYFLSFDIIPSVIAE